MPSASARMPVSFLFFQLGFLVGSWAARIPDIKAATGLTEAGLGLLLLVMASGAFCAFPMTGRLVDRLGAARTAKGYGVFILAAFASIGFAPNVPVLGVCLFLSGLAIGGLDVSMNAWGAEAEKALKRPVMSSFHGLYSLGAAFGAGAGAGAIELGFGVGAHFLFLAIGAALPVLWTVRFSWTSETADQSGKSAPLFALAKGPLFMAGLVALLAALGEGAVTDWAALYQQDELGVPASLSAVGFSVFSVAMVSMRFAGDHLIARFGPVRVARVSGLAAFVGMALLASGMGLWVLWVGCAIMGLGYAVLFPLAISRAAADPHMSKGAAIAAVATLGYGAFLFGPPILGFIGSALSLRASFVLTAVLALAVPFLASALRVEK